MKSVFRWVFCVGPVWFGSLLQAQGPMFENKFTHSSGNPIESVTVVGERCSGTNYVKALIQGNFPGYRTKSDLYAKKHFLPWIDLSAFQIAKKGKRDRDLDFLKNSQRSLFVVVVRNPYDWLRSFYAQPHHVSPKMLKGRFFDFLQNEWQSEEGQHSEVSFTDHWNPYEGRPFKNVLELRKYKTLNYLQVGLSVEHFFLVQYEKVAQFPELFIDFMAEYFQMEKTDSFQKVDTYKNEGKKSYEKKRYPPFSVLEFQFVNQEIDWKVEELIEYLPSKTRREIE